MHNVIIVTGLGDWTESILVATKFWKKYGLEPVVFSSDWFSTETFSQKLNRLVVLIRQKSKFGKVSLVGISAGASLSLHALQCLPSSIFKLSTICGRLKPGKQTGFQGFDKLIKNSPAFKESIEKLETGRLKQKSNILTIHPLFGDELVPRNTTILLGAKNISIPSFGHAFTVGLALTLFSRPLLKFILE